MVKGVFAIYPTAVIAEARDSAVVFCDDIEVAKRLCDYFATTTATPHSAVLVMPDWPDAKLINNLNGVDCVAFSTRDGPSAHNASLHVRRALGKDGA